MLHFRLRKADAADDRDALECDKVTPEGALLEFGQRLEAVLSFEGETFAYVLQHRDQDGASGTWSAPVPVYVLSS